MPESMQVRQWSLGSPWIDRPVELGQLKPAAAVRRVHGDHVRVYAIESDDPVHPPALDPHRTACLEAEVDEEFRDEVKIVDDDTGMIESPHTRHSTFSFHFSRYP
jgi:hypothetical protein